MGFSVTKSRSMQQAGANTETEQVEVRKTYQDKQGNVSHADVRRPGINKLLPHVPNSSGIRLIVGMPVTLNWRQGSPYAPHIIGAAGSAGGALVQGAVGSGTSSGGADTTTTGTDYSSTAFLLVQPDEDLPLGLTIQEGANVAFEDTEPTDPGDGSGPVGGDRFVHARPRVETELPDPTGLPEITLVDLVDGDGASLGMYRLQAGAWIRRDSPSTASGGGGGSDVTTADRTKWNTASTNATQALSDAAAAHTAADAAYTAADAAQTSANGAQTSANNAQSAANAAGTSANNAQTSAASAQTSAATAQTAADAAQLEITNARTRNAISGSFPSQTFANLKNHLMSIWNVLTARTADPSGAAVGSVLTYTGSGLAFAPPPAPPAPTPWAIANFATTTGSSTGGGVG